MVSYTTIRVKTAGLVTTPMVATDAHVPWALLENSVNKVKSSLFCGYATYIYGGIEARIAYM